MPNYIISDNVKWALRREARRLFELHASVAESAFPLDVSQVRRALIPAELDNHLQALRQVHARLFTTRFMHAIIEPQHDGDRGVLLQLGLDRPVTYLWEVTTDQDLSKAAFKQRLTNPVPPLAANHPANHLAFDWSTLDTEAQAKLRKWIHHAQLQRRRATAARALADAFIFEHCKCTGELLTRWPGMRTLFLFPEERNYRQVWKDRINDPPKRQMSKWGWMSGGSKTVEWYLANAARIDAADALLQGAALLDKNVNAGPVEVTASVIAWDMAPLVLAPMPEPVS